MSQERPSALLSTALAVPKIHDGKIATDVLRSWNTRQIGLRLGADAASAATASLLVAPIITIIDQ